MHGQMMRRQAIRGLAALGPAALATPTMAARSRAEARRGSAAAQSGAIGPLPANVLPGGVRSRFVHNINGLRVHVLEAGFESGNRPGLVLLHGFPELAYSCRKMMVPLADAGYHVFAPDLRGYGRTTGWDDDYDGDLASFGRLNVVRDVLGLVSAFGYRSLPVIGHDFGSPVAAWCAIRSPTAAPYPGGVQTEHRQCASRRMAGPGTTTWGGRRPTGR